MKNAITLSILLTMASQNVTFGQKRLNKFDGRHSIGNATINTKRFYDIRGGVRRNSIKIEPFALFNTVKLNYEAVLNSYFSVGGRGAFQYLGNNQGSIKVEAIGKYFLKYRAPIGA